MGWVLDHSNQFLKITRGRSTAFFAAFFVAGTTLACFGKLTPVYVAFVGTLGGLVVGHSIQENLTGAGGAPPGGPDADAKT
jgi:hypothetical protein